MEYLQNYVQEDVKMIQSMEGETPEKITGASAEESESAGTGIRAIL